MNIENLCQYNSGQFLKLLGLYIQQRRCEMSLTVTEAALIVQMSEQELRQIELGQHDLNDDQLLTLTDRLYLAESEILNLARITQVQEIIQVTRELNANYPR
jgi:hypothetical protein